jgi:catechol 2,3-dioxygenase-like lactoylglutathione lyase family enzyme
MAVEKMSFVLPAPSLAAAVAFWTEILGIEPTFVDGDRWAQFDHQGVRLALAGSDRVTDAPGVMLKVGGLEEACETVRGAGRSMSDIELGSHERRAVGTDPAGWPVILYEPRKR